MQILKSLTGSKTTRETRSLVDFSYLDLHHLEALLVAGEKIENFELCILIRDEIRRREK